MSRELKGPLAPGSVEMDFGKDKRKMLISVLIGAVAGYGFYYFIGCSTGACPITSNPWMSTGYGALLGWLAASSV